MTDARDGQSRTIRQFQFTDWPEQGVPKSGEGFIDFIGQVSHIDLFYYVIYNIIVINFRFTKPKNSLAKRVLFQFIAGKETYLLLVFLRDTFDKTILVQ